jgi:hypothetical protein
MAVVGLVVSSIGTTGRFQSERVVAITWCAQVSFQNAPREGKMLRAAAIQPEGLVPGPFK